LKSEFQGYNARQFTTEFLNKGWTKNSIHRLLVKFGTVDRRPCSGRRSPHTDENVNTVESLLLSQEDKPQSHRIVREISREAGGSTDYQFRGLFTKNVRLACHQNRYNYDLYRLKVGSFLRQCIGLYCFTDKNEIWRQSLLCGRPSCMEHSTSSSLWSWQLAFVLLQAQNTCSLLYVLTT